MPLTRYEVEQALSIVPGRLDHLPQIQGSLSIAQLCGPFVELFGDNLHFVHFTVKELVIAPRRVSETSQLMSQRYLFKRQTDDFLDLMQATLDLTTTCLTYLCLDLFEPEIEEEDLTENILSGGYRLHAFAASRWVGLVRNFAGMLHNQTPPDELITSLEQFITERENMEYINPSNSTPGCGEFEPFKQKWPNLHTLLCRAREFCQLDVGSWRLNEGTSNAFPHVIYIKGEEICYRLRSNK